MTDKEIVVERRNVKEDGFVVQEEFGEEGEVLSEELEIYEFSSWVSMMETED